MSDTFTKREVALLGEYIKEGYSLDNAIILLRGNPAAAQEKQEPVAYVPRSKAPGSEGEPIWREVFEAKWLNKGTWQGFDLMPLYAFPSTERTAK